MTAADWVATLSPGLAGLAGLGGLLAAIFAWRRDTASRFDSYTTRIENRLKAVEDQLATAISEVEEERERRQSEQQRRFALEIRVAQLERVMTAAGLPVPPPLDMT